MPATSHLEQHFTRGRPWRSAWQTTAIGGIAAAAARSAWRGCSGSMEPMAANGALSTETR